MGEYGNKYLIWLVVVGDWDGDICMWYCDCGGGGFYCLEYYVWECGFVRIWLSCCN